MDFFDYQTIYSVMKSVWRKEKGKVRGYPKRDLVKTPEFFYQNAEWLFGEVGDKRAGNQICSAISERNWYQAGCPYYKIYPRMAEAMSEVSIDIASEMLYLPFKSFLIRLADSDENTLYDGGPGVKTILVSETKIKYIDDGRFIVKFGRSVENHGRALHLIYVLDAMAADGKTLLTYDFTLGLPERTTIEDRFLGQCTESQQLITKGTIKNEYVPTASLSERILRLSVAACFFGIDQHEVVMPDLPRRMVRNRANRERISIGEAELQEGLEQKESGNVRNWTIGKEIDLPRPIQTNRESNGTGKQLEYGYVRRGHMRWQVCGEKRQQRKLIFVHPHLCRPDLELRPAKFRISDSNLEGNSAAQNKTD